MAAETQLQHTVGINAGLKCLRMMKEQLMKCVDAKRMRLLVLEKLRCHHHVTAQQAQTVNGITIVQNTAFLVWALQQIMQ